MRDQYNSTATSTAHDREKQAEQIVRDNIDWMLSLSNRILNDRALAEDAVQEAFQSAFMSLHKFEGRSSLKSWLHRITINACLKEIRQIKRKAEQNIDELLPEFDQVDCRIEPKWEHMATVEQIMEKESLVEMVRRKIYELPEEYRIVLQLRDIEGYSIKEVIQILDITESNVKVRLHRARAALKKLLEPVLREGAL